MLNYTVYRSEEKKPWVTFIHGAGGSSTIWFKQIKSFSKFFNLLLIDLRGHGKSKHHLLDLGNSTYTFDAIAEEIVEVLDHENIQKSHFMGISLGTILIRGIAEKSPQRVKSMIMGGAILKLNFRSRLLMRFGNATKSILPYMWLYKILAFIIMPNRNHKESRLLFIREAKKLYQKEFIRWFGLTKRLNPLLRLLASAPTRHQGRAHLQYLWAAHAPAGWPGGLQLHRQRPDRQAIDYLRRRITNTVVLLRR